MKKFLAILTIVAMLSSMVVIGASAASTYAFEEDFEGDFGFGDETVYKHPNDYSSSISLVDAPKGLYKPADVADLNFVQVTGNGSTNAIETARFAIKVPSFFEGKTAGTYTVEFDYKLVGGNTSELYAMRLDVGSTEGGGAKYIKNKEGFNANNYHEIPTNTTATGWQKVKTVLTYDGSVVENPDCDDTALVLLIGALNAHLNPADYSGRFQIDNIKVYPVDNTTGTVVDYAGKDMVVNNTVYVNNGAPLNAEVINAAYDQNGNLRAVGTAPVAIEAGEANKTANVTIEEIPAGVTANWTFKSFLWSDLDNEIEPLYDVVNPFDANVKQSIGVEFKPVTSVPDDYTTGTFTMAKDWVSNGAYCLTDYALNGRYSMFIPNGKAAYLVDDGFLAKNGEGVYTVRVWFAGDNTLITRLNMNGKTRRHNGDTDPFPNNSTHVKENGANVSKTVNGKTYYLHEVTLETALLTGDSSAEPQGFKFGAYNGDKWVEVESIVFTPAQ